MCVVRDALVLMLCMGLLGSCDKKVAVRGRRGRGSAKVELRSENYAERGVEVLLASE